MLWALNQAFEGPRSGPKEQGLGVWNSSERRYPAERALFGFEEQIQQWEGHEVEGDPNDGGEDPRRAERQQAEAT